MNGHTDLSTSDARRSHRLGLPLWTLAILALLGVPRVVLHDLGVIHEGTAPNLLLVVAPPLVWIAVRSEERRVGKEGRAGVVPARVGKGNKVRTEHRRVSWNVTA